MPRTRPLPKSEIDICNRLRQYREAIKCSRSDFAREAGVPADLLTACEHFRSPLRYSLAVAILNAFAISPQWLAAGVGPMSLSFGELPGLEQLNIAPRALFSDVFRTHLAARFSAASEEMMATMQRDIKALPGYVRPDSRGRSIAEYLFSHKVAAWIDAVPDDSLNKFLDQLNRLGEAAFAECPKSSPEEIEKRQRELAGLRASIRARSNPVQISDVDKAHRLADGVDVRLTWEHLRKRLVKVTAEPGMQTAAAAFVGVNRSNLYRWINGEREPGAEAAFRLLEWVTAEEAKLKSPDSARTLPEQATPTGIQTNEDTKSRPGKSSAVRKKKSTPQR